MNADLRACAILECLIERLHDVTVDYKCGAGVHEFTVCYAGSRFMLRFPEQALLRRGMQELEQMLGQIVERIRSSSGATTRISASADAAVG
jgi:hypothetical protein